jgi:prolipoprotein diacylglyceryltransferase
MGMLLSVPMVIAGVVIVVLAWRRSMPKPESNSAERAP